MVLLLGLAGLSLLGGIGLMVGGGVLLSKENRQAGAIVAGLGALMVVCLLALVGLFLFNYVN